MLPLNSYIANLLHVLYHANRTVDIVAGNSSGLTRLLYNIQQ